MSTFVTNKPGVLYAPPKAAKLVQAPKIGPKPRFFGLPFSGRVSDRSLSDLFDHLATLLTSGIPMLRALDLARSSTPDRTLLQAVERIARKVRTGHALSEALQQEPAIFSAVVRGMVRAAETSGRMDQVLREVAQSYARRSEMKERVTQALAYPLIILCFGFLTVTVLICFVIPKLTAVFELWDTPLPWITRLLLGVSSFMSRGGWIALPVLAVGAVLASRRLLRSRGRAWLMKVMLKTPLLSRLFFLVNFTRLARTWGMLLRSGVPILEALRSSREVLDHPELAASAARILESSARGSRLEDAIASEPVFPRLAKDFLSIGEETGTLDQSFDKVADYYERELDKTLKLLTTLLEPLLILAIGVIVGVLVISLLLPIFEMSLVVE